MCSGLAMFNLILMKGVIAVFKYATYTSAKSSSRQIENTTCYKCFALEEMRSWRKATQQGGNNFMLSFLSF